MNIKETWIAFTTLVRAEIRRTFRMWSQSIIAPAATSALYFIIFGNVMGHRIGQMEGYSYIQFIAPGLIMMSLVTSAYNHTGFAFYLARFQRNIEEIFVSPMPNFIILSGYMVGGVIRGLIVGLAITVVALFFTHIPLHSVFLVFLVGALSGAIFAVLGIINAVYAKSFDAIAFIPTFILTPLSFLGGVFYSVNLLPGIWHTMSLFNPLVYIIETFRYGFLGVTFPHFFLAFVIMFIFLAVFFLYAWILLIKGVGVKE